MEQIRFLFPIVYGIDRKCRKLSRTVSLLLDQGLKAHECCLFHRLSIDSTICIKIKNNQQGKQGAAVFFFEIDYNIMLQIFLTRILQASTLTRCSICDWTPLMMIL
ncbi:uncharacterized protein LOC109846403 [Asparagus officinalis]|uniref:uncharacterized protein LOC109846403 n=1 Tax=Asparagus officinalis TaxID=4686 RepID=UPI00098E0029|nr:uncharacterized protein LOC109846403 [Asparagus officinalis]